MTLPIRRVEAGPQHDEGLDDLGALRIGLADDSDLGNRLMLDDAAFDIERADAVAGGGDDDVVVSADKEDMTIGILLHGIAGQVPITAEARRVGGPVAVERKQRRCWAMHGKHSRRVGRRRTQIIVEHRQ